MNLDVFIDHFSWCWGPGTTNLSITLCCFQRINLECQVCRNHDMLILWFQYILWVSFGVKKETMFYMKKQLREDTLKLSNFAWRMQKRRKWTSMYAKNVNHPLLERILNLLLLMKDWNGTKPTTIFDEGKIGPHFERKLQCSYLMWKMKVVYT